MTIADTYPAHTDANDITWYRPIFHGKSPPPMWGWTSQPDQAHPDYTLPGAPAPIHPARKDTSTVIEMQADGSPATGLYTEFMRYPLPPPLPRVEPERDHYSRYKLPSPTTGRPTAYTRTTTVSSTTADHYGLNQWKFRNKVMAVLRAAKAAADIQGPDADTLNDTDMALATTFNQLTLAIEKGKSRDINAAIDLIDDLSGGADARELGLAVHAWCAAIDYGQVLLHQVPAQFQPYVISYQDALHRAGLVAMPDYIERVVLNDRGKETIAGTLDRIYLIKETGELILGDIKTSKTLDLSMLEYGVQLAIYGYATLMLGLDGKTWEPMPDINQEIAVIVHLPSDQPDRSQVVPFNMWVGGEGAVTAIEVRRQRREFPKQLSGGTTPVPSRDTLRWVEARQRIQSITSADDCVVIREEYGEVWTDDLTEFGAQCFGLITATEQE